MKKSPSLYSWDREFVSAPPAGGTDNLSDSERESVGVALSHITGMCSWDHTPQGHQFWLLVARELERNALGYYLPDDDDEMEV